MGARGITTAMSQCLKEQKDNGKQRASQSLSVRTPEPPLAHDHFPINRVTIQVGINGLVCLRSGMSRHPARVSAQQPETSKSTPQPTNLVNSLSGHPLKSSPHSSLSAVLPW